LGHELQDKWRARQQPKVVRVRARVRARVRIRVRVRVRIG